MMADATSATERMSEFCCASAASADAHATAASPMPAARNATASWNLRSSSQTRIGRLIDEQHAPHEEQHLQQGADADDESDGCFDVRCHALQPAQLGDVAHEHRVAHHDRVAREES